MVVDANPSVLLDPAQQHDTLYAIRKTERLFVHLGLRETELSCAQEALEIAKALYEVNALPEAVVQARRAEALALSLNERFNTYVATWKGLQKSIAELEQLGFPTDSIEAAIGEAEKAMTCRIEEEGTLVPDYVGATAWLEKAMEEARVALQVAKHGSREILLASLALEALRETQPSGATAHLVARLEGGIEHATQQLALGQVSAAFQLASEVRCQADDVLAGGTELVELGEEAEGVLRDMSKTAPEVDKSEVGFTVLAGALGRDLPTAKSPKPSVPSLSSGGPSPDKFERAQAMLERVERTFARLKDESFFSPELDEALAEAHRAMDTRDWAQVRRSIGRASRALVARRNERAAVARAIVDLNGRVTLLEDFGLPFLSDVHQLLERAREELERGRLSDASDFLICANDLVARATRAGS